MKYDYVLFDLDGTLTDPAVGITESVIYALEKSGVTPPERESLYKFIGPPLMYSFREYCGMTEEEAVQESSRCLRCDHFGYGIFKGGRVEKW